MQTWKWDSNIIYSLKLYDPFWSPPLYGKISRRLSEGTTGGLWPKGRKKAWSKSNLYPHSTFSWYTAVSRIGSICQLALTFKAFSIAARIFIHALLAESD